MIPLIEEKYTLVFIDEAGFNFNLFSNRAWCDKGKKFYYPVQKKSCNYTVTAAMTYEKILGYVVY